MTTRQLTLAAATALLAATSTAIAQDLNGAGATFPYPIYSKWFSDYAAKTGVKINYQSIGSGGGIRQFTEGTVDFGASDAPMSNDEMAKLKGPALHFPTVLGADVISYNIPGVTGSLKLTGSLIADIFLGKVTKWNDPQITKLNPGVKLPSSDILVAHRSDGSGTTYIFTDYLSSVSPAWSSGPGRGKDVQWPVGLGGKGNEGVAGLIKQTPGALGYIELAYAKQNNLPMAQVQNAEGEFVTPSTESATRAAAGAAAKLPANTDYRISIVNAPGKGAYPISSFTWLLVAQNQADPVKGKKLVDFLRWYLSEGEKSAASLDYAPLPDNMIAQLLKRLDTITLAAK
ncbi:MAG TPA: phosphate ABC transporter substrate-binding protein PstS [Gemmatimonadaceae bacterium]|nr:phosphate ABC transporter substrate-binding protein PstS [Gemmatimonadaceae bacterium]